MHKIAIGAALTFGVLSGSVYGQQATPSAVPVGTVYAESKPLSKTLEFVGRVDAKNRVEVRARVKGYLEEVLFAEGELVAEGAPLYRIEKDLFQAAVEQAEGALASSKALLELAIVNRKRQEELFARSVGTAVARDEAVAKEGSARGAVTTDEANLSTAKINLGYTDIKAPVAGKVGRTNITKGNVVGPDSGVLTVIVSQDPMYVIFPVSQREFLRAEEEGQKDEIGNIKAQLRFADGSTYDQIGRINFVDVTVDRATDTVLVRATFPNPKSRLIDGQLVRVVLESGTPEAKVLVPQAALIADQQGVYVFVIDDGKANVRRLKTGGESGPNVIVDQGLAGGEQIIVEGVQTVRPGMLVRATPLPHALSRN
jgi:membrane fusion protein, multidrug efflux system